MQRGPDHGTASWRHRVAADRFRGDNAWVTDQREPATRATRLAANAAAFAVVAWAVLSFVTTQIASMRASSPFADDPWDAVVSYAAIFLPIVVGATWIRSLSHRGPQLEPATARRIRNGVGIALLTIGANVVSDAVAILVVPTATPDGRLPLIIGLVFFVGAVTLTATALLVRAMRVARPGLRDPNEPDVLDDLLALARDAAGVVRPFQRPAERLVAAVDRFLANSAASPRRHRLIFGLLAAVVAGLAFDVWHEIVEGPWASMFIPVLFATLVGGGVFVMYLITLVPLRLIRPASQ